MTRTIALAVLGDPLAFTLSPVLHRAGLRAAGCSGDSRALRTAPEALAARMRELAAAGCRGANLTTPLKETALGAVDRMSEAARRSRSINTVGFESDGVWGETTDGPGFVDLLGSIGRPVASERAVVLGAGGAARSLALALAEAGAKVTALARSPGAARSSWGGIAGATLAPWSEAEAALSRATLVVNATPLEAPCRLEHIPRPALIVDLRYGPEVTEWVRAARAAGREAYDGLGLLVFQARRSLALWLACPIPVDPLARAVGWPR